MKLQVIKQRNIWWAISAAIVLAGIVGMLISLQQYKAPLRPGLDFVGGTRLQIELACVQTNTCTNPIDPAAVRDVLAEKGLGGSSIQIAGTDQQALSIRTTTLDVEQRTDLLQTLSAEIGAFDPEATQIDTVGPTIGRQLFSSGLLALLVSLAGIMIYLSLRFQFDYAVFAIAALLHDVLITLGVFAILGLVLGVEADSLFIVALLTIVGFSVNDTVVIYDRIRETVAANPHRHINEIVEEAVNQTLTRSLNTTLTVLLTLTSLFVFGGETLKYFALALIVGFTAGAYSSIFIASTLLALWREKTGRAIAIPETPDEMILDVSISPEDA